MRPHTPKRRHRIFAGALLLLTVLSCLAGCASAPVAERSQSPELLWPPPPSQARIAWVREISDYRSVGISKGFWSRVVEVLVGEETESRIGKPYGVYADPDRIFIVDVGRACVHLLDMKHKKYSVIGEGKDAVLRSPIGVTEDDRGNVYITDSGSGLIYRYNLEEKKLRPFTPFKIGRPTGIAFSRKNRHLYVSDTLNHRVLVLDLGGTYVSHIGERGHLPGQLNFPTDLFVDKEGEVYVTDALNSRVQIFSPEGALLKYFGKAGDTSGYMSKPKGVAVDSDGHIYVADAMFSAVQIFDRSGRTLLDFGQHGTRPGEFWMPSGIYIDKDDYIYVADSYNRRVQVFRYLKENAAEPKK
ncbi:SMP-30/gluconolactonase/LRE family protein [Geomonas sp. RF6]|uniref:SMP-30/gluconolactonase/LRE family protein n=1 Tax=Geomonas sp. RF6 TaxID=2897342 RepID=UPI001E49E266|nr:SMP-30/gluconolactonase/LRE family protein [Geomonas sp. RF6]UFS71062.1 SMP-30/gluconolactonase/LRE family protein [Geomonas sp. RF6]